VIQQSLAICDKQQKNDAAPERCVKMNYFISDRRPGNITRTFQYSPTLAFAFNGFFDGTE
jgi:hypothetical protein